MYKIEEFRINCEQWDFTQLLNIIYFESVDLSSAAIYKISRLQRFEQ